MYASPIVSTLYTPAQVDSMSSSFVDCARHMKIFLRYRPLLWSGVSTSLHFVHFIAVNRRIKHAEINKIIHTQQQYPEV